MLSNHSEYWVVEYEDPHSCTGESVASFCQVVASVTGPARMVVCGLNDQPYQFYDSFELFADAVKLLRQIDWADIHFVDGTATFDSDASIQNRIATSRASVRVADNTYLVAYTTSVQVKHALAERFPGARLQRERLDEVRFMF